MKFKYVPQRNDINQTEIFEGEVITITQDSLSEVFDFTDFPEGAELTDIETILPINPIVSAKRIDGTLYIGILKPHGNLLEEGVEYPNTEWQEVTTDGEESQDNLAD